MMRWIILGIVLLLLIGTGTARGEIKPDFLMNSDPELRLPDPVKDFTRDFKGVWIQALQRPDIDLQRMTAETIALAHQHGIPDLIETVPALEAILTKESSHPAARFAAARALIVLDSRASSEKLWNASQAFGSELRQLVEPAMAEWNFGTAKSSWAARLESKETRPRELVLAIRGVGRTNEVSALPTLKAMIFDQVRTPDIRLEAAVAAGKLAETGLETDAAALCRSKRAQKTVHRLCAVQLLARHRSDVAIPLLLELAVDEEPSVAAKAFERLNDIDPTHVLPLVETAIKNADPFVRREAARAYLSRPNPSRVHDVALLLDDPHPDVRSQVREGLFDLSSNPELSEPVRSAAMDRLSSDGWKGQEQASLLLGELQYTPASGRLVELLESPREQVMVASAWALRKIADPTSIPGIVHKIRRQTIERRLVGSNGLDLQVAHLFEACAQMNAKEGIPLMLEYVPKSLPMGVPSRGAAIHALGKLHAGSPDKAIVDRLHGRITDMGTMPPEFDLIKQQSAIALARMKAVDEAPTIRKFVADGTPCTLLGLAYLWAIKELTGEELPEPGPMTFPQGVWFLDPLGPRALNWP